MAHPTVLLNLFLYRICPQALSGGAGSPQEQRAPTNERVGLETLHVLLCIIAALQSYSMKGNVNSQQTQVTGSHRTEQLRREEQQRSRAGLKLGACYSKGQGVFVFRWYLYIIICGRWLTKQL